MYLDCALWQDSATPLHIGTWSSFLPAPWQGLLQQWQSLAEFGFAPPIRRQVSDTDTRYPVLHLRYLWFHMWMVLSMYMVRCNLESGAHSFSHSFVDRGHPPVVKLANQTITVVLWWNSETSTRSSWPVTFSLYTLHQQLSTCVRTCILNESVKCLQAVWLTMCLWLLHVGIWQAFYSRE